MVWRLGAAKSCHAQSDLPSSSQRSLEHEISLDDDDDDDDADADADDDDDDDDDDEVLPSQQMPKTQFRWS